MSAPIGDSPSVLIVIYMEEQLPCQSQTQGRQEQFLFQFCTIEELETLEMHGFFLQSFQDSAIQTTA